MTATLAYMGGSDGLSGDDAYGPALETRAQESCSVFSERLLCLRNVPVIRVVAPGDEELPRWFSEALRSLEALSRLEENWDSYGAAQIKDSHITAALYLLGLLAELGAPAPIIGPTVRGGVVLEWHMQGVDLEIDTRSSQRYLVSFEDSRRGVDWEREVSSNLTPLVECIAQLS